MRLETLKKLAAVSAVALLASTSSAMAATPGAIQIGTIVPVGVQATVENTITVDVVAMKFGTLGAMKGAAADTVPTAQFDLNPDSTFTESPGIGIGSSSPASIVNDPAAVQQPAAATVAVTGAFQNTDIYVTYSNITNPVGGGDTFDLISVNDDLATPGSFDPITPTTVIGQGTTSGAGALSWNIGGVIQTQTAVAATAYTDGAYVGSFDMRLTY